MASTTVALTFRNEAEARLLESVLLEEDIPHFIRSFQDAAYGQTWPNPGGWGQIEAPPEYHERILRMFQDLVSGEV